MPEVSAGAVLSLLRRTGRNIRDGYTTMRDVDGERMLVTFSHRAVTAPELVAAKAPVPVSGNGGGSEGPLLMTTATAAATTIPNLVAGDVILYNHIIAATFKRSEAGPEDVSISLQMAKSLSALSELVEQRRRRRADLRAACAAVVRMCAEYITGPPEDLCRRVSNLLGSAIVARSPLKPARALAGAVSSTATASTTADGVVVTAALLESGGANFMDVNGEAALSLSNALVRGATRDGELFCLAGDGAVRRGHASWRRMVRGILPRVDAARGRSLVAAAAELRGTFGSYGCGYGGWCGGKSKEETAAVVVPLWLPAAGASIGYLALASAAAATAAASASAAAASSCTSGAGDDGGNGGGDSTAYSSKNAKEAVSTELPPVPPAAEEDGVAECVAEAARHLSAAVHRLRCDAAIAAIDAVAVPALGTNQAAENAGILEKAAAAGGMEKGATGASAAGTDDISDNGSSTARTSATVSTAITSNQPVARPLATPVDATALCAVYDRAREAVLLALPWVRGVDVWHVSSVTAGVRLLPKQAHQPPGGRRLRRISRNSSVLSGKGGGGGGDTHRSGGSAASEKSGAAGDSNGAASGSSSRSSGGDRSGGPGDGGTFHEDVIAKASGGGGDSDIIVLRSFWTAGADEARRVRVCMQERAVWRSNADWTPRRVVLLRDELVLCLSRSWPPPPAAERVKEPSADGADGTYADDGRGVGTDGGGGHDGQKCNGGTDAITCKLVSTTRSDADGGAFVPPIALHTGHIFVPFLLPEAVGGAAGGGASVAIAVGAAAAAATPSTTTTGLSTAAGGHVFGHGLALVVDEDFNWRPHAAFLSRVGRAVAVRLAALEGRTVGGAAAAARGGSIKASAAANANYGGGAVVGDPLVGRGSADPSRATG
ncbi:unnamed protein product [Phaeothamnion confervicola]